MFSEINNWFDLWNCPNKQRWFSGRILACHAGGPGSIPGRCNFNFASFVDPELRFCVIESD